MSIPFRFVVGELFEIESQCVIQAGLELVILVSLVPGHKHMMPYSARNISNNLKKIIMCMCCGLGICKCVQEPKEARNIRTPGYGITGSCEPADMAARNQTWVFCKGSKCLEH